MRKLLLASTLLAVSAAAQASTSATTSAVGACVAGVPNSPAADGGFGDLGGQLYTPDGQPWAPRGIGVMYDGSQPSAAEILADDPGTNLVRLAIYATPTADGGLQYPSAAELASYVDDLTSHGIYVVIEDHTSSDGQDRGGQTGTLFTGNQLADQLAWYQSIGAAFANNPYVGAASTNEPSDVNPATGQQDPPALAAQQLQEYDAFRQGGSNGIFWFEINGWNSASSFGSGISQSAYAGTTNTAFDLHIYPWLFSTSADESQDEATLQSFVATAQQFTNQEGAMPVSILEYGDSTEGGTSDPNWQASVDAVENSGLGTAAWAWGDGSADSVGDGGASPFATMTASFISGSGATGCPVSAIAPVITAAPEAASSTPSAANGTNLPAGASISDVAALAAQEGTTSTSSSNSIAAVAQDAATGQGGTLNSSNGTDPTVSEITAGYPVLPVVLSQPAPTGTSPTPMPATGTTSIDASGNGQTIVAGAGNGIGTVAGNNNVVQATGGIEDISVTGSGNQITTGPYNDTITLSSGGNTVDGGGGNDTVVLAYGGGTSVATNADLAAEAPLSGSGNTFIAPAPGTGTLTIQGTLAQGDTIDLTQALAGTTWDHTPASMWQFVTAAASPTGCTISIGGQIIVRLPGGSPEGNLGPYIVAH